MLKNVLLIVENVLKRHSRKLTRRFKRHKWIVYVWRTFNLIFNLFMLAWIITGSYWIFSSYATVHRNDFMDCNELLYKFGFSIVISSYILLVLMCCCTCICAGICLRRNKDQDGEDDEGGEEEEEEGEGDYREGGSRNFGESEGELENESLARETEGDEEETELNDGYLNGHHHHHHHRYNHSEIDNQIGIDISDEIDATDPSREAELLMSPTGVGPRPPDPVRLNNGVLLHQYDSSPFPSRHHFTVRRVYSSGANLNASDLNVHRNAAGDDEDEDSCFRNRNLEHANSSNFIPVPHVSINVGAAAGGGGRRDRPLSLSHVESHSHDSIPAMRACALIRNRVHHSSHSSGLYVTQYSDGFSVTAV